MASLFISRSLAVDSPLRAWCSQQGIKLVDQSLLRFQAVAFGPLPAAIDWVFFYSPRAVEFFWAAQPKLPDDIRFATLGPGTAERLSDYTAEVDFVGSGDPNQTAADFGQLAASQRVLFPRAVRSRRSIERYLGDTIEALDLVVYQNEPQPTAFAENFDWLVFTSPLNFEAFLAANKIDEDDRLVAIGPATAAAISGQGYAVEQAEAPTEAALVKLLSARP
ncbi:MAG: uroporphyrinogen-III synthase [Bacteroidota bacterium]